MPARESLYVSVSRLRAAPERVTASRGPSGRLPPPTVVLRSGEEVALADELRGTLPGAADLLDAGAARVRS